MSPLLVVTLPPDVEPLAFARSVRADRLEIRSDLHNVSALDLGALHAVIPLLIAQRTPAPLPTVPTGAWVDRSSDDAADVVSHHASEAVAPSDALAFWKRRSVGKHAYVKHVEPMGTHSTASRLLETQRLLREAFPHVTVLCTGDEALPWRCILSTHNALDYVAASRSWSAAAGQRLLADALRSRDSRGHRLGILGSNIQGSRSPRIHPQPFDRLELPPSTDMAQLLGALHPHYRGFAVTSPFKRAVATARGEQSSSVNTLWRTAHGWNSANTDVAGAVQVLSRIPPGPVTVLGDGGVTDALRSACSNHPLTVLQRKDAGVAVEGTAVWTWPAHVDPPPALSLQRARVVVVAYGPPAWRIARQIRERGGTPVLLGPTWFMAQARQQRRLWKDAA